VNLFGFYSLFAIPHNFEEGNAKKTKDLWQFWQEKTSNPGRSGEQARGTRLPAIKCNKSFRITRMQVTKIAPSPPGNYPAKQKINKLKKSNLLILGTLRGAGECWEVGRPTG
jgi:hypothetical protein